LGRKRKLIKMKAKLKMTKREFDSFISKHPEVKISTPIEKATTIWVNHGGMANWDHVIPSYPPERVDRRRGFIARRIEEEYKHASEYGGKPKEIIIY